jgi:transposase
VVYQIEGALASSLATRQALVDLHSCFILATNELDTAHLPPHEVLHGYKGQVQAERGFRFLKDPQFVASSLYLKKPERIMALLMVMTVCLLVYAALEYRIRQALKAHEATFPNQKGKPIPNPTARWVFQYSLLLDSGVLAEQQLNERTEQRFTSLSDIVHKLEEPQVERQFLLGNAPMRA